MRAQHTLRRPLWWTFCQADGVPRQILDRPQHAGALLPLCMISFNVGACFWSPELTVCGAISGRTRLCEASNLLRSGSRPRVELLHLKHVSIRMLQLGS